MTVLTVFRSVSELHNHKQDRAAKGVVAEATVHWTNIITTKGNEECMKRATLNDPALHRPVAARGSCVVALFCISIAQPVLRMNYAGGYVLMLFPSCSDSHTHIHYLGQRLHLPVRVGNYLIPCVATYFSLLQK